MRIKKPSTNGREGIPSCDLKTVACTQVKRGSATRIFERTRSSEGRPPHLSPLDVPTGPVVPLTDIQDAVVQLGVLTVWFKPDYMDWFSFERSFVGNVLRMLVV